MRKTPRNVFSRCTPPIGLGSLDWLSGVLVRLTPFVRLNTGESDGKSCYIEGHDQVLKERSILSQLFLRAAAMNSGGHFYEFGPFRIDVVNRLLFRDHQPLALTPKAVEILIALVAHGGQLLKKDDLIKIVWPDRVVEEGNL